MASGQYSATASIDNSLYQSNPTGNGGTSTALYIGFTADGAYRTIMRFTDLPTMSGISVTNATLVLKQYYAASAAQGDTIKVYLLTRDNWTEGGSTWNKYDSAHNWTTGGGDYSTSQSATGAVPNSGGSATISIDVKSLVETAISGSSQIDLLIKLETESNNADNDCRVYSSEYTTEASRPKLTINYTYPLNETVESVTSDISVEAGTPAVSTPRDASIQSVETDISVAGAIPTVTSNVGIASTTANVSVAGLSPSVIGQRNEAVITETATIAISGNAPDVSVAKLPLIYPYALQLYSTSDGLPITTLYEFAGLSYSRAQNEAAQVSITFPAGHPANQAIRDIYTAEPHGIYGILYRRGLPWCGVILAETEITRDPISWSFLGFEALLREHFTPWSWHGYENMSLSDALTSLIEVGHEWHQISSTEGFTAATKSDVEIKTWAQLSGEATTGAYNQPMIVLSKHGTGPHYMDSGTVTFAWDFGAGNLLDLARLRWRCSLGEWTHIAAQYRYSTDGNAWSNWTDAVSIADQDVAENYGIAAAGNCRYCEAKFTLSTEDTTTKNEDDVAVGTSPVLFGVELITTYSTGIDAYSIDVAADNLPQEYKYSHENHLAIVAAICEDYGYAFKVDHLKRATVWTPAATSPVILKKGDTCEPTVISYRGLENIQNSLTCYGAGEGLGRLSALIEDADSISIYGRRPGIFEDAKQTTLTALQAAGQDELFIKAWPQLDCQIKAPYEPGRGVLDCKLHDYIQYIDSAAFTGTDSLGQQIFEVIAEQRDYSASGEMVTLGLDSSLDNYLTRQSKADVKGRKYRRGRLTGQIPFDVRAVGAFGSILVSWHGSAPEYIVEFSATGTDGWSSLRKTADRQYLHNQLASGATYYYRVSAVYSDSISSPSAVVSATTTTITPEDLDTTAPATPTGLNVTTGTAQTTAGGIVIINTATWSANSEDDLSFYELRRSLDESAWIMLAVVPTGETSFIDTQGLVENTTYYYQVRAVDRIGNRSNWSASDSVATVPDATAPTFGNTAPSVTAGFKRLVPRWAAATSADISHYILQRQEAPAEWDDVNEVYIVPETPVPGSWADITGSAIRALQYHDTAVDFDTCYRYKVAAVDTSGNTSSYTNASAWAVPAQIGTDDAAYRFITAEMYGEIRNVLPFMWSADIDATHPIEVPFYIPSETTQIVSVKLSAYGERFRANSTGAAGGSSHSHSITLSAHSHSVGYTITSGDGGVLTGSAGAHTHTVSGGADSVSDHTHSWADLSNWTDEGGADNHDHGFSVSGTTGADGGHDHSVDGTAASAGAHTHSQQYTTVNATTGNGGGTTETSSSESSHTHDINYGIYESTTPAGVNLYIDSGAGYGTAIALTAAPVGSTTRYELAAELDITASISGTGWKRLKLTSTRLGSVEMQLICKVDVTA